MQETKQTKNPHPHKELMKLWIEDRDIKIQFKDLEGTWTDLKKPSWIDDHEYRLKPPDPVAKYKFAYGWKNGTVRITTSYYKSFDDFKASNVNINADWVEPIQNTKTMVQP